MTRLSLRSLLTGTDEATLRECLQRWCDDTEVKPRRSAITRAATAMEDEALVLRRIAALPRKLQDLLEVFFVDGRAVRAVGELFEEVGDTFKSRVDLAGPRTTARAGRFRANSSSASRNIAVAARSNCRTR